MATRHLLLTKTYETNDGGMAALQKIHKSARAHNASLLILDRTGQLGLLQLARLLPQQRRRELGVLLRRTPLRLVQPRKRVRKRVRRRERQHQVCGRGLRRRRGRLIQGR